MSSEDPTEDPTLRTYLPGETSRLDLDSQPTQITSGSTRGEGEGRLPVGMKVANRYTIRGPLGIGGMGAVYRVWDEVLGIELALKMLRPEIAHDQEFLERFRNELLVARQVSHRNVVRIHDIGDHQGLYFMTMDLVEGRSLRQVLQEEGRLDLDRALPIIRQIASALAEAHRRGVVHRDLKPANILIDPQGEAYVTDFGIARSLSGPALTRTGEVLGTPDYLSPEQARGEKVDGRSDLYSLGLMLVEMLSGKLPFPGGTLFEVLAQRMSAQVPNLVELGIDVPPAYAAILERCTSPDPEQRYADADELLADLGDLRRPAALVRQRRLRRTGRWLGLVALVALAAFGAQRLTRSWLDGGPAVESEPSAAGGEESELAGEEIAIAPPTHALAVLPVGDAEQRGTLEGLELGLAAGLAEDLARNHGLRVVDPARVLAALEGLGIAIDRVRVDQLVQLADVFQVDGVVVSGLAEGQDGDPVLDLALFDGTQPDQPLARLASLGGDTGEMVAQWGGMAGVIGRALGLPGEGEGGAGDHGVSPEARMAYVRGMDHLLGGRGDQAVTALEKAVELAESAPTLLRLSEAYERAGRPDEALETASQAAAMPGGGAAISKAKARVALLRGAPGEAQEPLAREVEQYPYETETRLALADAYGLQGDFAAAVEQLRRAVALDEAHPRAWYLLGRYAIGAGEVQAAVDDYLVRALILRRSLRDDAGQAEVHTALGVGYQRLGRLDQAIESYGEAAEIRRRLDDRGSLAKTLHNLGWIHLAKGEPETAAGRFEEAFELYTALGDRAGIATLHNAFGSLEEVRGRGREALEHFRRALQIRDDLGDEQALAESHGNVGFTYSLLGEYDNALLHLERALAIHRRLEQPRGIVQALQSIGLAHLALGRWPAALEAFEEALPIARQIGAKTEIAVSRGNQGRIAQLQGRYDVAFTALGEARDIVTELGDPRGQVEFGLFETEARLELGDFTGAGDLLDRLALLAEGEGVALAQKSGLELLRARWRLAVAVPGVAAGGEDLEGLVERAAELATASQDPVMVVEVEHVRILVALAADPAAAVRDRLAAAAETAERLGHLGLRLRLAETRARVELAAGGDAVEIVRDALRLAHPAGGYAGAYRLQRLLEKALTVRGDVSAANRAGKLAEAEIERLRGELGPLRDAFDALVGES